MKAVVIGARRARQGIGAFVAEALVRAGCTIAGVVGTSHQTVREPAGRFDARGYLDTWEAIETERPDLVAICSPIEAHREQLAVAGNAGCHCLCDKPLWWSEGSEDTASVTSELIGLFEQHGKYLGLLTQWPHALPAFYRLHPDVAAHAVESFAMHLGPTGSGASMLLDSMSHPLSLLERIAGQGEVENVAVRAAGRTQVVNFTYRAIPAEVTLTTTPEPPRPAAFAINGRWAHRAVEPGYELFLEDEGRRVPMDDPMPLRVQEIVEGARAGRAPDRTSLELGMSNLARLMRAVE